MRPAEWSKTFGNMVIAALIASSGNLSWIDFIIAFIAAGPLLWGGLYTLNDWTDWRKDKEHPVKKIRPIPSGDVSPNQALIFSLALLAAAFAIAYFYFMNLFFIICLTGMMMNQVLYTMRPFNLKKVAVLDLISGSLINPFFRFFAGWTIVQQNFSAPIALVIFVVAIQFGGYTLYRLSSKEHEKKLGYKSSSVVFPEKIIKGISYLAIGIAGISFLYAIFSRVLPFSFILLVILSALSLPLYYQALKDPKKMNMEKVYRLIYLHYALFIAGFIILSYFKI